MNVSSKSYADWLRDTLPPALCRRVPKSVGPDSEAKTRDTILGAAESGQRAFDGKASIAGLSSKESALCLRLLGSLQQVNAYSGSILFDELLEEHRFDSAFLHACSGGADQHLLQRVKQLAEQVLQLVVDRQPQPESVYRPAVVQPPAPFVSSNKLYLMQQQQQELAEDAAAAAPVDTEEPEEPAAAAEYDGEWLRQLCGSLDEQVLEAVRQMLVSNRSDEALQAELFELLGADRIEALFRIVQQRRQLCVWFQRRQQGGGGGSDGASATEERLRSKRRKAELRRLQRQTRRDQVRELLGSKPQEEEEAAAFSGIRDSSAVGRAALPSGTERRLCDGYEEYHIPPVFPPPKDSYEHALVPVSALERWAQAVFSGITHFNRMQSKCFTAAYTSNENLLVCAPTGAGKTNVALLSVLQELRQHIGADGTLRHSAFKIVYVAPMKALAQEVVAKFGKRLRALGVVVRELTGDMQLSKREIEGTHIIVTTPEKWDVITRKSGDGTLAALVRLLIFDEVHILHDDRGSVIEILVARTIRQVESSQTMIRIVGLSATLPNYEDVAAFLRVNPATGLLVFDASYRPVPLEQLFIGVSDPNSVRRLKLMDRICHDRVVRSLREKQQCMVFVHSRKGTVTTAEALLELARELNTISLFESSEHAQYALAKAELARCSSRELRALAQHGIGIHNAGMMRPDRLLVEKYFTKGVLKVLVCTATLAWGVNLPAHTVLIKGTQLYDAQKGGFVDLSMLDVMQIFGRAGRPQFDTSGEGVIITSHDRLAHYLRLLTLQMPIESQFILALPDNLNAEVNLGTVSTMREAMLWLGYTYLYVRMKKNPTHYGITYNELQLDPSLTGKCRTLLNDAVSRLTDCRMLRIKNDNLVATNLGRTASHYYIHHESVERYNRMLHPDMDDADLLRVIASSKEFEQIKVRNEELSELDALYRSVCFVEVRECRSEPAGKSNVLLQSFISRHRLQTSSLISDTHYITQSAGRICRALFEIALKRGWVHVSGRFLSFAKMIDRRQWDFETPLRQFHQISAETCHKIEDVDLSFSRLLELEGSEIGELIRHRRFGNDIKKISKRIPRLSISYRLLPVTSSVVKVQLGLRCVFDWLESVHGTAQPFHVWLFDEYENILHSQLIILHKRDQGEEVSLEVFVRLHKPLPSQYFVSVNSDLFLGSESAVSMPFVDLALPQEEETSGTTTLLDLRPLPVSALLDERLQRLYSFTHFNAVQTQAFHVLFHTDANVLFGAPTGSGKTTVAELALLRLFGRRQAHSAHRQAALYVAPLKALARERLIAWRVMFGKLSLSVEEMCGGRQLDASQLNRADIIVATPEKLDAVLRNRTLDRVALVIFDEVHLLGQDRGAVLERIVSKFHFKPSSRVRFVALSTAVANAVDLASWLGVEASVGLFNFHPSVRPVPLSVHIAPFPGRHYCPRMQLMNKPTYSAILTHSPDKPALVFVSSRRQTRLTALGLIALVAADEDPHRFCGLAGAELEHVLASVKDEHLRHALVFGIGLHHAGLHDDDRSLVELLFAQRHIQVLVSTATLAWGVNLPAHLVVIKGTEFFDARLGRYLSTFGGRRLLMPLLQFDSSGVACVLVEESKLAFYRELLYSPFPVESSALSATHLADTFNAEVASGSIRSVDDAVDYLATTFLFRRLQKNPTFYQLEPHQTVAEFLLRHVLATLEELHACGLLLFESALLQLRPLRLGELAARYYLRYSSARTLRLEMRDGLDPQRLLHLLASVEEFAELPVRHNEELLNEELSRSCAWKVSDFGSAHTKTNLLLQSRMQRVPLPISDYETDRVLVLEQCMRVLNAMLEWAAHSHFPHTCVATVRLMQSIVQARMPDADPLLTLGLNREAVSRLGSRTLPDLQRLSLQRLNGELSDTELAGLKEALAQLPLLQVLAERKHDHIHLDLRCNKRLQFVRSPGWSRRQLPSWWLLVCGGESRVYACTRARVKKQGASVQRLPLPPEALRHRLTLHILSDSFLGLDQSIHFPVHNAQPIS